MENVPKLFVVAVALCIACGLCCDDSARPSANGTTTLCGQASLEFQELVAKTRNFTSVRLFDTASAYASRMDLRQVQSLTPLRGRVVNRIGDQMVVAGCQYPQQIAKTVVGERTVCCTAAHVLSNVSVARIGLLVQLVLDRLASMMVVDYVATVPIRIFNESFHACPVAYDFQQWNFDDAATNFGVVITAYPHSSGVTNNSGSLLWERAPMWALPCAWDQRHRPIVTVLNVNPEWLQQELNDEIVMQEAQHHLLHGLGFDATLDIVDNGAPTSFNDLAPASTSNVTSVWEENLEKNVVYWSATTISADTLACQLSGSGGIPMDDEFELTALGAYPNMLQETPAPFAGAKRPWGSHYEARVIGARDVMSSSEDGRHSWNISLLTKELFQSLLPVRGISAKNEISVPHGLPRNYSTDGLFLTYLDYIVQLGRATSPGNYLSSITPPSIVYARFSRPLSCEIIQKRCIPEQHTTESRLQFCVPAISLGGSGSTNLLKSCTPDFKGFMDCAGALETTANSSSFAIPYAYQYRLGSRNVTGLSPAADFCPLLSSSVLESSFIPCAFDRVDVPLRGNVYSNISRCVESNVTLIGPRPADVAALRCVKMRCVYGLRIEMQLNASSVWIPCPLTGESGFVNVTSYISNYTGTIRCAAAGELCGAAAPSSASDGTETVPWYPLPSSSDSFNVVNGFGIEFHLAQYTSSSSGFTRVQGKKLCGWMPHGATLAFIPSLDFASAVATELPLAVQTVWVGATSQSRWDSMHGRHTASNINVPPGTTGCYVLNITKVRMGGSGIIAAVDCNSFHHALCTRAWSSTLPMLEFPSCPRFSRCSPTTLLVDPRLHRSYFLSVNASDSGQALFSRNVAAVLCSEGFAGAMLLNLDNLTSIGAPTVVPAAQTPWYQALFSVVNALQPNFIAVWSGLTWTSGTAVPPWSDLVQNWPPSTVPNGVVYCFLLVQPGIHFEPLFATFDCSATFPAVCFTQNPIEPIELPGYDFKFYLNHVPVSHTRAAANTFCSQIDSGGFLSPMLDNGTFLATVLHWHRSVASGGKKGTSWYFADGTTSSSEMLLVGAALDVVSTSAMTLSFPYTLVTQGSTRLSANAASLFVPNRVSDVEFNATSSSLPQSFAVVILNSTNAATLSTASVSTPGGYVCAVPKAQTAASSWVSPVCSGTNATNWCDPFNAATADYATDSEMQMSRSLFSFQAAVDQCTIQGGLPLFTPVFDNKNFSFYNLTQVAASALFKTLLSGQLFWSGLKVSNGILNSFNGATYSHLANRGASGFFSPSSIGASNPQQTFADDFADGTCIAGYFVDSPLPLSVDRVMFKPVDCNQALYAPCKRSLIGSPPQFVPWSQSAVPPTTPVGTILPFFSFAVVSLPLSYTSARRVCRGYLGDLGWIPRTGVVATALGNIVNHPNISSSTTRIWMGFSKSSTDAAAQTVQNAFRIPFGLSGGTLPVEESPSSICVAFDRTAGTLTVPSCATVMSFVCMRQLAEYSVSTSTASVVVGVTFSTITVAVPTRASPQAPLTGYDSVISLISNASALGPVQLSNTAFVFAADTATQTGRSAQFISSESTFIPVPLLLQGFLRRRCCGLSAYSVSASSVVTVFPRPQIECSVARSGPFAIESDEILDISSAGLTLYCRLAVVAPGTSYDLRFDVVSTARGEFRSPSNILALSAKVFNSVQRNTSSTRLDWGGFSSNIIELVASPQVSGGIVAFTWAATSCSGTCVTTSSPAVFRTVRVMAPRPAVVWGLGSSADIPTWLDPAKTFTIALTTLPFGADLVTVNLTSNCSNDVLIMTPSFFVFRNATSALGVSAQLVPLLGAICEVTAHYRLDQRDVETARIMLPNYGSVMLGTVALRTATSQYFRGLVSPAFLVAYPGDHLKLNLTRQSGAQSSLSDIVLTYAFFPSNLSSLFIPIVSGGNLRITSVQPTYTLNLVVQNDSNLLSQAIQGASLLATSGDDVSVDVLTTFSSSAGIHDVFPAIRVALRKRITVLSLPTLIATGVSTSDSTVLLSLPQAPASSLNITVACANITYGRDFSSTIITGPKDRVLRTQTRELLLSIPLVPPDKLTDAEIPFDTLWNCQFVVSGALDVDPNITSFSVTVRKRGRGSLASSSTILRPNHIYTFSVNVQSSSLLPRSVSVLSKNISVNGTILSMEQVSRTVRLSPIQADTTLTECIVNLTVPLSATYLEPTFVVLQIELNDTVWFRNPPSRTLELIPLIALSAIPPDTSFTFSQPVGSQAAQTLGVQLSSLPRQASVTIVCSTVPDTFGGVTIASFSPKVATLEMATVTVTNASLTRVMIVMTGVVPNVIVSVVCRVSSPEGELLSDPSSSRTLTMLSGASMQFVPLLQASISILNFPGVLFVGLENERQVVVQVSTLPLANITVNLTMVTDSTGGSVPKVDPIQCIKISPNPWVLFGSTDAGSGNIVQNLTLRATCDSSTPAAEDSFFVIMARFANVTLQATLNTLATNIDRSENASKRLAVTFPILPKRIVSVVHLKTDQPLTTATLYCGGSDTSTRVIVNVSALPLEWDATATIAMKFTDSLLSSERDLVYSTPSELQFSKKLSMSMSRQWLWTCAANYFTGPRAHLTQYVQSIYLGVDGPTEFATPGPTVQLILRRLLKVSVILPDEITVGSQSISITVAPELLPEEGQVLVIDFVSSCPSAIRLQHGNSIFWTAGMADSEQALRVLTYKAVQDCTVSLQLSLNSTARNYESTLYNQTVNLYEPSLISWLLYQRGNDPRTSSDALTALDGVELLAKVDQANSFVGTTIVPYPLIGVTQFGNNTDFVSYVGGLSNNSLTTAVYAMSNVPDSGSSGLLAVIRSTPNVIRCVRHSIFFPNILNITIQAPFYTPSQDELITLVFTQYSLTRADAPLSSSGTNISFYVVASGNRISEVRESLFEAAYTFAAAASLLCGPALATRAIHMVSILDLVACPSTNWRIQKANAMTSVFSPIRLPMGTDETLGPYIAAAVYGVMLFAIIIVLHIIAMFLVFARRLELQTKTDASTGVAMALLRFPSVELFPALYLVGIVVHATLKVMVYSDDSSFRAAAIVIFILVGLGIPALVIYFSFFKAAPVVYQEYDQQTCSLFRPRGLWILDPLVLTIANEELRMSLQRYLPKYGMLIEEQVGSTVHSKDFSLKVSRLTSSGHRHAHRMEAMQALNALEEKQWQQAGRRDRNAHADSADIQASTFEIVKWRLSKHYYVFDVLLAVAVAGCTVFEPTTIDGCMAEAWVLLVLFVCQLTVFIAVRPFRYHYSNALQALMSCCQVSAMIAILVSFTEDTPALFVQDTSNGCLVALACIMIVNVLINVFFGVASLIRDMAKRGYKTAHKVLALVGDGEDLQDHNHIEVDENVPLRELLTGFVDDAAIEMTMQEAQNQRIQAEWEDIQLVEEAAAPRLQRLRSNSRLSVKTAASEDVAL